MRPMRFVTYLGIAIWLSACVSSRLLLSDHPLAGRVWDSTEQRFVSFDELERRVAAADVALLGEIHDNPEHHRIQLRLLQGLTGRGKKPALAMEQIDSEWQADVDVARLNASSATAIAQAGRIGPGWEWPLYRPLVSLAVKQKLPIVAANFSRARARPLVDGGHAALGIGEASRLALDGSWSGEQNAVMRNLLVKGHCGRDNPVIDKLIPVQRARDAVIADNILGFEADSTVAIIGRSHARNDVGVPYYLNKRAADSRVLSLGMVEVDADKPHPSDYPEALPGVHELVWFTPKVARQNACAGL